MKPDNGIEDSYVVMQDDFDPNEEDWGEDELRVNWCILGARVGAILLLLVVIVLFALGAIKPKLFALGGIALAVLLVCLYSSFLECCRKRFSSVYVSRFSFSGPDDPTTINRR